MLFHTETSLVLIIVALLNNYPSDTVKTLPIDPQHLNRQHKRVQMPFPFFLLILKETDSQLSIFVQRTPQRRHFLRHSLAVCETSEKRTRDPFPTALSVSFSTFPRAKCNIGCDTSTCLSAGWRPASIQPRLNTSMFLRDPLPPFCWPKVAAISPLWTSEPGWTPTSSEDRSTRTCQRSALILAQTKLLSTPLHNIGAELINLSALLLDYMREESGDGWNSLSEGGFFSTQDGIHPD